MSAPPTTYLQALPTWRDPTASFIFTCLFGALSLILVLLGIRAVIFAIVLYFLRPPQFRDPAPSYPGAFFVRLPALIIHSNARLIRNEVQRQPT
jgi:hypothetical protein